MNMKRYLIGGLFCLLTLTTAHAQSEVPSTAATTAATAAKAKYGTLSYDALLCAMPEYAETQNALTELRKKYEAEAAYNEMGFKRMFSEFLSGQKDFPKNILLKRQRDLQEAMEKALAFRQEADSLLRKAEAEMLQPLRVRLDAAIQAVGAERGYETIVNTDQPTHLFFAPNAAEDATPFVQAKLTATPAQP